MSFDYLFKCILIGNTSVGKSSILLRFMENKFVDLHDITIGVEFHSKLIPIKDKIMRINLWDTAGQESFKSITKSYYRSASAVILVFDVTDEFSFYKLDDWMRDINEMTYDPVIVLIGNKTDLVEQRKVSYDIALQYAEDNGMHYAEVSAKDHKKNIDEIFELVAKDILTKIENGKIDCQKAVYGVVPGPRIDKKHSSTHLTASGTANINRCC